MDTTENLDTAQLEFYEDLIDFIKFSHLRDGEWCHFDLNLRVVQNILNNRKEKATHNKKEEATHLKKQLFILSYDTGRESPRSFETLFQLPNDIPQIST